MTTKDELKRLACLVAEFHDQILVLANRPAELIEVRFHKEVVLPLKELTAGAENMESAIALGRRP